MKIYALEVIILPKYLCTNIVSLNPIYIYISVAIKRAFKSLQIVMSEYGRGSLKPT